MSGPVQLLILLTESFNIKLPLCQRQVQNFPKMGGTNPKVETPAYYLAKFCRKMHENGGKLDRGGHIDQPLRDYRTIVKGRT